MGIKKCTKCNELKSIDNFVKNKYNHWCKDCRYKWNRDNYAKNNPLKNKFVNAKRNYNIDIETFNNLMTKDNCEICNIRLKELKDKKIDHDHKTGKIRGILCNDCNQSLGKLKEDINTLQSMINYINKHNK